MIHGIPVARYNEGTIQAPSVVFAVLGEAKFSHLRRSGLRHLGCRYGFKTHEVLPDALWSRCSGWGHIQARRSAIPKRG